MSLRSTSGWAVTSGTVHQVRTGRRKNCGLLLVRGVPAWVGRAGPAPRAWLSQRPLLPWRASRLGSSRLSTRRRAGLRHTRAPVGWRVIPQPQPGRMHGQMRQHPIRTRPQVMSAGLPTAIGRARGNAPSRTAPDRGCAREPALVLSLVSCCAEPDALACACRRQGAPRFQPATVAQSTLTRTSAG